MSHESHPKYQPPVFPVHTMPSSPWFNNMIELVVVVKTSALDNVHRIDIHRVKANHQVSNGQIENEVVVDSLQISVQGGLSKVSQKHVQVHY